MRSLRLKTSTTAVFLAGSLALAGAACGGDDDDVDTPVEDTTETGTETTTG